MCHGDHPGAATPLANPANPAKTDSWREFPGGELLANRGESVITARTVGKKDFLFYRRQRQVAAQKRHQQIRRHQ